MASRDFFVDIDLNQSEIQFGVFQNLGAAPSVATEVDGQFYYDTGSNTPFFWNGSSWTSMSSAAASSVAFSGVTTSTNTTETLTVGSGGTLTFSGTGIVNASQIDGDVVEITGTPADNELLAYDNGSSKWINQTATEAGLLINGDTFLAADGTSSNPGFGFNSEADNGMYRSAQDTIIFVVGGAEVLKLKLGNLATNPDVVMDNLGDFSIVSNSSTSVETTKWIVSHTTTTLGGVLELLEGSSTGTNAIRLKAPASVASNQSWILPETAVAGGFWKSSATGGSSTLTCELITEADISGFGTYFDTAGTGLTSSSNTVNVIGGSGITANANDIDLDINSLSLATIAGGDFIPFWDITATADNKKMTFTNFQAQITSLGTIATGVWEATDVAILHGGTGASTAQAAIDNLAGLTTQGDILVRDASNAVRLGIGTSGFFLKSGGAGTTPSWAALLEADISDFGTYYKAGDTILAADGSAANPSHGFNSEAGNGMYLAATDIVAIAANGIQIASFDKTGGTALSTFTGNLTVTGDLLIEGTTTTINTQNLIVEDNFIVVNSAGIAQSAGIEVERDASANAFVYFDEIENEWFVDNADIALRVARKLVDTTSIAGNGALLTFVINHSMATSDVVVAIYDPSDVQVEVEVVITDANNITVNFSKAPSVTYKAIIVG